MCLAMSSWRGDQIGILLKIGSYTTLPVLVPFGLKDVCHGRDLSDATKFKINYVADI